MRERRSEAFCSCSTLQQYVLILLFLGLVCAVNACRIPRATLQIGSTISARCYLCLPACPPYYTCTNHKTTHSRRRQSMTGSIMCKTVYELSIVNTAVVNIYCCCWLLLLLLLLLYISLPRFVSGVRCIWASETRCLECKPR